MLTDYSPEIPDKPSEPDLADGLSAEEQAELVLWLDGYRPGHIPALGYPPGPAPTLAGAKAKVEELEAYYQSEAYRAWLFASQRKSVLIGPDVV